MTTTLPTNGQTYNATELQWLPSVQLDTWGSVGDFDKFTGGDVVATPTKHRPGGMGPEIAYPSLPTFSDVTVSRVYDEGRDHDLIAFLHTLVGNIYGTVSLQPLDSNGNPWGTPRTYRGRLASVKDGQTDSTSHNPRMWEMDFSIETEAH